jgi:AbiJ N-terminal domain 4
MPIKLWQRKQGLMAPPEQPLHATAESEDFPETFRTRLVHWTFDFFSRAFPSVGFGDDDTRRALNFFCQQLAEAYGRPLLVDARTLNRRVRSAMDWDAQTQIPAHVSACRDVEVLDFVDAVFQHMTEGVEHGYDYALRHRLAAEMGDRLNEICDEEGIGYRWTNGELVRFDDPVAHGEAIQPALNLLADGQFGHANAEFRRALECFRSRNWRDAITNANAAFESVLQIITEKPTLTAGPLIREARHQGVIPGYAQNAAENLEKLMNLVPAVRGQAGAHGLGARPDDADEDLARLVVTSAAAFIVFAARNAGSAHQPEH